jgi:hypothetical protein
MFFRRLGAEKMALRAVAGRANCRLPSLMPSDELSTYYSDLLDGSYDCVDRTVLNF